LKKKKVRLAPQQYWARTGYETDVDIIPEEEEEDLAGMGSLTTTMVDAFLCFHLHHLSLVLFPSLHSHPISSHPLPKHDEHPHRTRY